MSRKHPSFGQVIDYMDREELGLKFRRNLYSSQREQMIAEFLRNSELLAKRKRGNYLYHEVISIKRNPNLSLEEQQKALLEIAEVYAEKRAKNHLVYGRMHTEEEHLHVHLCISANEVAKKTRKRLSKARFLSLQREMEQFVLEQYPELKQTPVYQNGHENLNQKISNREGELKRRTKAPSRKDQIREKISLVMEQSIGKEELEQNLSEIGFELYQRGKQFGVIDKEGKKYRLKTLGLEVKFSERQKLDQRMEQLKQARKKKKQRNLKQNLER